ncbi:hypothetical protein AB0I10_24785 [Streptomyces sp. NPDC050636]|uniref:hypothetical protein n=1 Tax=Streptomyces sp. NPDC050636 TaxID=3154510 RepID=UPI0034447240
MTYHSDVKFLDDCNPALIERNAAEFKRMYDLLHSVVPSVKKAENLDWTSASRTHYDARLRDVDGLTTGLMDGYHNAWKALLTYAEAVERAKRHLETGEECQSALSDLLSRSGRPLTPKAKAAEPMRQWEDLRETTGFLDWLSELTTDADAIRDKADHWHSQASDAFRAALETEQSARKACTFSLRSARDRIPEFRTDFKDAAGLMERVGALQSEADQARRDPHTHLAGSGEKADFFPGATGSDAAETPALRRIRQLCADLPEGKGINYLLPSDSDEHRKEWIGANREILNAAAAENGLPPEMLAGIAWQEVEGDPAVVDDVANWARRHGVGKDADQTSMGPMSIQIRRAAEVLGYDPAHLTDAQRSQVTESVKDPAQNAFIVSEYLSQLKAESSFAEVPADRMTPEQYQELAARYNGGPYWESDAAQGYGRRFMRTFNDSSQALK